MADSSAAHADVHSHPGWQMYVTIAIILFALTAMEVGAYEIAERGMSGAFGTFVSQMVVEILLVLSAAKFALVAMFYMHLKSDGKLLTGVFGFSLALAAFIVVALLIIFSYLYQVHPTANPLK